MSSVRRQTEQTAKRSAQLGADPDEAVAVPFHAVGRELDTSARVGSVGRTAFVGITFERFESPSEKGHRLPPANRSAQCRGEVLAEAKGSGQMVSDQDTPATPHSGFGDPAHELSAVIFDRGFHRREIHLSAGEPEIPEPPVEARLELVFADLRPTARFRHVSSSRQRKLVMGSGPEAPGDGPISGERGGLSG